MLAATRLRSSSPAIAGADAFFVIAGHSRSKNGVASLAYDPAIHAAAQPKSAYRPTRDMV